MACTTLADDVSNDVDADVAANVFDCVTSDIIDDVAADAAGDMADDVILSNRHKLHLEIDTDQALNSTQNTLSIVTDLPSLWSQKVQIIFEFEFAKDTRMTTQFHRLIKAEFTTKWTTQN